MSRDRIVAAVRLVREAIAGTDEDFTRGSFNRAIVLLAIPMMLEMLMEAVFAIVDIFRIARWADIYYYPGADRRPIYRRCRDRCPRRRLYANIGC